MANRPTNRIIGIMFFHLTASIIPRIRVEN